MTVRRIETILFLAILALGSGSTLFNILRAGMPGWVPDVSVAETFDTRLAHRIDNVTADNVPRWPALEGLLDGLRYRFLGDAGSQVRVGCPGWLFLAEEVLEVPHGDDNLQARLRIARRIAAAFRQHGVHLLVIPIPDKIAQTKAFACGIAEATQATRRLALWNQGVRGLSLDQLDPAKGWPVPGFWRTDTHWDQTGASYVAALAAGDAGHWLTAEDHQPVALETASLAQPRPGDLSRLAGLDQSPAWLAPPLDMERVQTVHITETGGLLQTREGAPVILVGTSYSLNSGFLDDLEAALQCQVLQRSSLGGGFSGAILDLLDHQPELVWKARLVIWEWPERALTLPLTEAEEEFLKSDREE